MAILQSIICFSCFTTDFVAVSLLKVWEFLWFKCFKHSTQFSQYSNQLIITSPSSRAIHSISCPSLVPLLLFLFIYYHYYYVKYFRPKLKYLKASQLRQGCRPEGTLTQTVKQVDFLTRQVFKGVEWGNVNNMKMNSRNISSCLSPAYKSICLGCWAGVIRLLIGC